MCRDHATIWEQLPHPAMKQTGEIRLRIPQELIARLDHEKPKVLSLTSFCALLIEQGIDKFDRGAKVLVSPAAGPQQGNLRPLTGNKPSLKQPEGESEALQEQQLPPQPTEAVQSSAQELDHEKKHIVVKSEIKVGFNILSDSNFGYSYSHISNNDWGSTNPGTDNQQLTFSTRF